MKNNLPLYCHNGSIAILTLWTVLFLSIFASAMGGIVAVDLKAADRLKWIVLGDAIAGRAFEDALSVIRDDKTEGYDFLDERWADDSERFKNVFFSGAHYSLIGDGSRFGLADESGKININFAPMDVLSRMFQIVGHMNPSAAEETAQYLVDWRDANTTKEGGKVDESERCSKFSKPYSCKDGSFEAVQELWWMPNMTQDVFGRIRDKITLYGPGQININTADVDVLRSLGLSYSAATAIVDLRKNKPFEQTSKLTNDSAGNLSLGGDDQGVLGTLVSKGLIGVRSDVYRGQLLVDLSGRHKKNISFIFNRNGELKTWNE